MAETSPKHITYTKIIMVPAGFELVGPARQQPQIYAATGIGLVYPEN
jgi:hypothetical protein